MQERYVLGLDVGSSAIKAALLDARTGRCVAHATSPEEELPIDTPQPGWAEQDPRLWWEHCVRAARAVLDLAGVGGGAVEAIGVAYQMHGLVLLDGALAPLRPAIIWCDSRATAIGAEAFSELTPAWCLEHLLGSPGNFTIAKLAWVKRHEPELYARARYALLPGDYIACRMTGQAATTATGLSEMALWDFAQERMAEEVLACLGLEPALIPPLVPASGEQGRLTAQAASELGLREGTPVTYRAGDQPNNALSLSVLEPGEVAATAGTSGVVYAVTDHPRADPRSRVNTFLHVNHRAERPRLGVLLCLSGAGSAYRWLRQLCASDPGGGDAYAALNAAAAAVPPGADGLTFLPYGNGAERSLDNRAPGAGLTGLDFNRHTPGHLARAVLEGVACALALGLEIMRGLDIDVRTIRAPRANLFLSAVFREALASLCGVAVELVDTGGAEGAARGAALGLGLRLNTAKLLSCDGVVQPAPGLAEIYAGVNTCFKRALAAMLEEGAS